MKITLEGKTALVTGSSRGIGLGVARGFVENGAKVIVSSEQPLEIALATRDDLVGFYVFAASDAARYGTGNILRADGGITAMQMPVRPVLENEGTQ